MIPELTVPLCFNHGEQWWSKHEEAFSHGAWRWTTQNMAIMATQCRIGRGHSDPIGTCGHVHIVSQPRREQNGVCQRGRGGEWAGVWTGSEQPHTSRIWMAIKRYNRSRKLEPPSPPPYPFPPTSSAHLVEKSASTVTFESGTRPTRGTRFFTMLSAN